MFGYLRTATIMPKIRLGNVAYNLQSIKEEVLNASALNTKLCVLPKLSLTGISLHDLFKDKNIINESEKALIDLKYFTQDKDLILIVSLPILYRDNLYEAAAVIKSGVILGIVPNINNDNINDDVFCRIDVKNSTVEIRDIDHGEIIYVPFGSDLSFANNSITFSITFDNNFFNTKSSIVFNITSIPETVYIDEIIKKLCDASKLHNLTIINATPGPSESSDNFVFFARSMVIEDGEIVSKNDILTNHILICDIDLDKRISNNHVVDTKNINFIYNNYIENSYDSKMFREFDKTPYINKKVPAYNFSVHILNILAIALAKRMEAIGTKDVVIGVSGGLDSTIALLIAKKACEFLPLTYDNIHAISMPGFGTTDNSNKNISELLIALSINLNVVDIKNTTMSHFNDIRHDINNTNVTYENAQARERMQILMDIANDINGIVVGTSDLSEIALGFSTYNGDHMSMYNVNGSLYKTLIKFIIDSIANANLNKNPNFANVLKNIIHSPITPELKPTENGILTQKTEEILGSYEIHDFILYNYLKYNYDIQKIFDLTLRTFAATDAVYTSDYIKNCVNIFFSRFYKAQYKRSTAPDSPDIGLPNLSKKFKMPNDIEIDIKL